MAKQSMAIGLDVGRHAVKAVCVKVGSGKPVVVRAESIRLSSTNGDNAGVVARWAASLGFDKHPCAVGLPGDKAMFHPFMLSPSDPRSLEQAASIEVIKFNEMASETMIHSFAPIALNPGERRLMLCMARPAVVREILNHGRGLGFDVVDVAPSPVALVNALDAGLEKNESPTLCVNIGAGSTEVAVGSSAGLLFARAFPHGGRMFGEALARSGELSQSEAENFKTTEAAISGETETPAPLKTAVDAWLSELQACVSVYHSLYPGKRGHPRRLVLAGGGARLGGLREYTASKLGVEPAEAVISRADFKGGDAGLFAVAVGLALTVAKTGPVQMSLLPPEAQDEMNFRRGKTFWIGSGIAAALIVAASAAGGYRDCLRAEKSLRDQKASLSARQSLVDEIEIAKARNEQIRAMAKPVADLVRGAPIMRELLSVVAASKAEGDSIAMICDAELYFSKTLPASSLRPAKRNNRRWPPAPDANVQPDIGLRRVLIEGYTGAADFSTVREMIEKLEAVDFVESADLLNDDEALSGFRAGESAAGQRFVIEVTLKDAMP